MKRLADGTETDRKDGRSAKLALLLLREPYDWADCPDSAACVALYGAEEVSVKAGIRAVFGELRPDGRLPVAAPANVAASASDKN